MKPFNLELAKAGHPVQTRDGRSARIICWDRQTQNNIYPIVAMIKSKSGNEEAKYFTQKGEAWQGEDNDLDLVMASTKKEGWVNVYKNIADSVYTGAIYSSEKDAVKHIHDYGDTYLATNKIEWEE